MYQLHGYYDQEFDQTKQKQMFRTSTQVSKLYTSLAFMHFGYSEYILKLKKHTYYFFI